MKRNMLYLCICSFDGFTERSCAAGKPDDIQHRTYIFGTAILFSVVRHSRQSQSFLVYLYGLRFLPPPRWLPPGGRFIIASILLRQGVWVKYILIAPFGEVKKARSLLQNFGLWVTKNGRQVFNDLSAVYADVRLYGSSNPYAKGK